MLVRRSSRILVAESPHWVFFRQYPPVWLGVWRAAGSKRELMLIEACSKGSDPRTWASGLGGVRRRDERHWCAPTKAVDQSIKIKVRHAHFGGDGPPVRLVVAGLAENGRVAAPLGPAS